MKKIDLGQTITILANIGVLAGIIFLAYELRQNTRATQLASAESALSSQSELDLLIAESEGFATLLASDANWDELDGADRLRLQRFTFSALRQWENVHYQYSIEALNPRFWEAYRNELLALLDGNERFIAFWRDRRSSFTPEFNEEMESILGSLSE